VSEQQQNAISDEQVRAFLSGDVCAACGGAKTLNWAFCRTDFAALTIWQRGQLAEGLKHPDFAQVFRSALRHLQLNTQRRQRLANTPAEWRHSSAEALHQAGYSFVELSQCRAPRCLARIAWWRTPNGGLIPINPADFQPHRASCRQPEFFQKSLAQTSARPRRPR
jgi:hypothetical protein